jgi:hypothetical protein
MLVTGTTWLGLTIGCANAIPQFDPITHKEYYRMMAFMDNADEPEIEVGKPEIAAKRAELERQIREREMRLRRSSPLPTA